MSPKLVLPATKSLKRLCVCVRVCVRRQVSKAHDAKLEKRQKKQAQATKKARRNAFKQRFECVAAIASGCKLPACRKRNVVAALAM